MSHSREPMSADLLAVAAAARTAMVDRLVADGVLTDPRLRDALLRVRREVLLPHAYVRVSGPGADPIDWRLLDGSHPDDQAEWLDLVHSGDSVLLQRDGEPLDALVRGPVTGGHMTSMSTYAPATVEVLQCLDLERGQRFLDLGSGPGISLALAAAVTGPGLATGVERDPHMRVFAQRNLDRLGLGAVVVEGDALGGHAAGAPYDRIHSGIGVPCIPLAWVEQLAPGGTLLTTLVTRTPSWPGQIRATRTPKGRLQVVLTGRPRGHRPLLGYEWLTAVNHRPQFKADPGRPRPTRLAPPDNHAYGFWIAAAYLAPGLVRDFQADTMTVVAPDEDSWAVAGPGDGTVRVHGPRDVWAELEDLHDAWERAGRPDTYRVDVPDGGGPQRVTSGPGRMALTWTLPPARHRPPPDLSIARELSMTQQPKPLPRPADGPRRPAGWSEEFLRHRDGQGCPMCGTDFTADDIGWGSLLHRGEVANAYLWRSGQVRGYCVLIHRGAPHVAEPTDLSDTHAAAYWADTLTLGKALTAFYQPVKMNYSTLGNVVPHLHTHIVPRYADPAPGAPLPWAALDKDRQDEAQLQADAASLRALLEHA